ncbi:unnamed protein product, partial [Adineta steineri]
MFGQEPRSDSNCIFFD